MEIRCPGTRKGTHEPCGRLVAVASDGFVGNVTTRCRRCDQDTSLSPGVVAPTPQIRLACACGKWLATGVIEAGHLQMVCPRDQALIRLTATGPRYLEPPPRESGLRPIPKKQLTPAELVALMEDRWALLRYDRAKRSSEVAVGIRFDVFNRDGFRCRYCGRGPSQGAFLEADHVIPRSAGGPDELDNLVTACWDCNRGKSAKRINPLDSENPAA